MALTIECFEIFLKLGFQQRFLSCDCHTSLVTRWLHNENFFIGDHAKLKFVTGLKIVLRDLIYLCILILTTLQLQPKLLPFSSSSFNISNCSTTCCGKTSSSGSIKFPCSSADDAPPPKIVTFYQRKITVHLSQIFFFLFLANYI